MKRAKAAPLDIVRLRLANQELVKAAVREPGDIVRRLGAVQAQDYAGAKWAVGMRGKGLTDAAVERALTDGTLVRTHVLRPTWHVMHADDARWILALTGPRVLAVNAHYCRKLELDEPTFRKSAKLLAKALEGGQNLTREELGAVLRRGKIDTSYAQRLAYLMMRAELDQLICSGPRRGKQFTYALFDERVPATKPMAREEALAELGRRYFETRGPATIHDFAWWSGLTIADAKRTVALLGSDLEPVDVDGKTYHVAGTEPPPKWKTPLVHLLPNYDEYFIGFRDRSAIKPFVKGFSLVPGNEMFAAHVVALNGHLIGGWKRVQAGKSVKVALDLVRPLDAAERRALADATRRFSEFLGVAAEVSGV